MCDAHMMLAALQELPWIYLHDSNTLGFIECSTPAASVLFLDNTERV